MTAPEERYTHGHHESVLRSHTWRTIENSAAYLAPHLEEGLSLLDIGCGPGSITVEFAERLFPGRVVGVDSAEEALAVARLHAEDRNAEAVFEQADAYALPYDDGSFDIVHAHQLLQHLARPVEALREFRRVVRPGGVVAVRDVDYAGVFWYPLLPGLERWLDLYERVHRGNGGEPDAGRRLLSWAREAGFEDVTATASIWAFTNEDDRAWWGGSWSERVLQSAFAADAEQGGHATRAELEEISEAWREWAATPDAVLMMPHGEVIARG